MILKKHEFIKLPYKLLIYDIETYLGLKADVWRCGDTTIRHGDLDPAFCTNDIICIAYKWYGEKTTYVLTGKNMIAEFDALVKQSDATIGKNSDRFDVKHINTQRLMLGLAPYPEWTQTADDLEKQLRKYFEFPSQSLDYISKVLGFGGKVKMEKDDWRAISNMRLATEFFDAGVKFNIQQKNHISKRMFLNPFNVVMQLGKDRLKKMLFYGKKDVKDTEKVLQRVLPYIQLRYNASTKATASLGKGLYCKLCGSTDLRKDGIRYAGQTVYQMFHCRNHHGYAGRATMKADLKTNGYKYGNIS